MVEGRLSTFCCSSDDLEVAPDFFSYFSALRPLLQQDKSLWCVSAWNDNGKTENIDLQNNGTCGYCTSPTHLFTTSALS